MQRKILSVVLKEGAIVDFEDEVSIIVEFKRGIWSDFSQYGNTPLKMACSHGHLETIRVLVENGANVNYCGSGLTPLVLASSVLRVDIVDFLLDHGAKVDEVDDVC